MFSAALASQAAEHTKALLAVQQALARSREHSRDRDRDRDRDPRDRERDRDRGSSNHRSRSQEPLPREYNDNRRLEPQQGTYRAPSPRRAFNDETPRTPQSPNK